MSNLTRITTLLTALAVLALAPAAQAARDPISSGSTDLHLKRGMVRVLTNNDIAAAGLGAGTVTGNKIALPVRDGKFDPTDAQGFLEHRGGFKLSRGERGVPITQVTVNTVKGAVFAQVAKAQMQLGTLRTPLSTSREGFGANAKSAQLTLTDKAARRISNRLGLQGSKRIAGGRVLSNAYSTAQPETVTVLSQNNASFALSPTALAKFQAKDVKVPEGITAIAPAVKSAPTTLQLPVAGGTIAPNGSTGKVSMTGGLQVLKQASPFSPTVRLVGLEIDFAAKAASAAVELLPAPPFPGAAGRSTIVDVVIPQGVVANPNARTIVVNGEARLQAPTASTFNDVFNQPPPAPPPASNFVLGDPLGSLAVTLQAQ